MVRAKPTFAAMGIVLGIMILSLWTTGGCSISQKADLGTTARWERQLGWKHTPDPSVLDRRVAEAGPRCLKDRLTPAFLRQEVARMEAAQGGKFLEGKWEGVDLSRLPHPQGQFLSKFGGRWIDKDETEFASCGDVPCILNRVYGLPPGSDEGVKIYAYYLRTGYGLSTSKWLRNLTIQSQALPVHFDPSPPLAAFLFSDAHLSSFWKLTWLLPESFNFMPTIQTIHRVPENYLPPGFKSNNCAISYGSQNEGEIQLRACLEESFQHFQGEDGTLDNGIHGSFYTTVSHEMTHSWDRLQAKKSVLIDPLSQSEEWRALSGWNCHPVLSNNKITGTECQSDPSKEGFVRDYAGTNPSEDLAETAAWVRFRPDLAKKRSPTKADFISIKLFGGRTYDSEGLSRYYRDTTLARIDSKARIELVNTCMGASTTAGTSEKNSKGPHLLIEQNLPAAIASCLDGAVNHLIDASFEQLRAEEWEACDHFSANEADLRAQVFANLSSEISNLVGKNVDRAPLIRATSELHAALLAQIDSREGYIHCSHQPLPEVCYQQSLLDSFERVSQPYRAELGDLISQEKQSFFAQNVYSEVATKTSRFYQQIFAGTESQLKVSANARWKACLNPSAVAQGNGENPRVQPFSGGTHFVDSSILNCINQAYAADLKSVRDAFISHLGLTVSDPDVQLLIEEQLLPAYLEALRVQEDGASAAEDDLRNLRKAGVIEVLKSELLANLSWLGSAAQNGAAQTQCELEAQADFEKYFSHVSESEQLPTRFAAIVDLKAAWSKEACKEVVNNPKVTQQISVRTSAAWNDAMKTLEQAVMTRARDTATDCIARNPGSAHYAAVKARRRSCMTNAWAMVEKQAVAAWEQTTPEGQFFSSRHSDSLNYLSAHRKALQADAFTAMESH